MINIGTWLIKFYNGTIGFFTGLANLFDSEISIPTFVIDIISLFNPNFVATPISVWILFSSAGAVIALTISVYFIIKGAI